jgi:hypothetical protein
MPKSKEEIYALFSPKFALKRKKTEPSDVPPMVDGAAVNIPHVGNPHKIHPTKRTAPVIISPKEGLQAVNGQAEKLDIRPAQKISVPDQGVAAIPLEGKKKPGRPKKENKDKK